MLVQPLTVMLDQVRAALQASRSRLRPCRPTWSATGSRPTAVPASVFPQGRRQRQSGNRRFRAAVATVTPAISGLPVAMQARPSTVAGAFVSGRGDRLRAGQPVAAGGAAQRPEVMFTLAPVILSIFLTLGTCVADRPADQLRQHHRLPAAVRGRRRLPHLFRDGVADRARPICSSRASPAQSCCSARSRRAVRSAACGCRIIRARRAWARS
jgi:hypothetical protein